MTEPNEPDQTPSRPEDGDRPTQQERDTAIEQIRLAMLRDEVAFEDLGPRFKAVHSASTRSELAEVVSDLPAPPPPPMVPALAPQPISPTAISLFGDLKRGGEIAVSGDLSYLSIFGSVVCDLSSATIPDGATISVTSVFGDTTVILPDGVRAVTSSFTVFGGQKDKLTAAFAGAPTVHVQAKNIFGDAKVYSLSLVPEGKLRKLWRSLRGA